MTQDDTLMTTLTVREAVFYSAQLQLPNSMSSSEKKERAEMTIREMGLQGHKNRRLERKRPLVVDKREGLAFASKS